MIFRWMRSHLAQTITWVSSGIVVALIATLALVSGGYTAQRLDLGDAAVWVGNEVRQSVGRANTALRQLNTVVTSGGASLDVVQGGSNVLVIDRTSGSLDIVDPATATVTSSVPLPPVSPEVHLTPSNAVITSDGDVWRVPIENLDDFDSAGQPMLSLGTGAVTSVDASGVLFSFTPSTGNLSRVDTAVADTVSDTDTVDAGASNDIYELTSVSGRWVLLNTSTRQLFMSGIQIDLAGLLTDDDAAARLQEPSVTGDRIAIAHRGGLITVGLDGGDARAIVTGRNGLPAAPVVSADCAFAAWADGAVWRSCANSDMTGGALDENDAEHTEGTLSALDSLAGDARLEFQQNGTGLLLNDAHGGAAWAVQADNQLIDNWAELIEDITDQQELLTNNEDTPPELDKVQVPPVAVDDAFGARPGRASILPVLQNDYDANGDALVVSEVTGFPEDAGHLDLISNGQQVQVTLAPEASGVLTFSYEINDGRAGVARATVTITVRGPGENSPPIQTRSTSATVQSGGRVTTRALGDWVDPDGDSFYLAGASVSAPDGISFTPEGSVTFTDSGSGQAEKFIALSVSDGRATGTGTLAVAVKPTGTVPIVTDTFVVLATVGSEVSISPLEHARGGSGPLRLGSVPSKPNVTITADFDGGTFRFVSTQPGTQYVDYAVTDGTTTANGQVRVDVSPTDDSNVKPVTVPHTAFARTQRATLVNVLAGDFDPSGGVLLITGASNIPADSGIRVEILEQRMLRVTLTKPLDAGSAVFSYTVSNGLSEATGAVTVMQIPEPAQAQAPIALPDTISVRVGQVIDIPVLDNDEHPDGDPLTLNSALVTPLPSGSGLLFTSGNVLRYLAPTKPGNFTAVYQVDAPDGQFATAEITISVRESDPASNHAPVPKTVTARVLAGERVSIPIPLTGIDADGDSVQLLGQETNPQKGAVTDVGASSIEYLAGDYSAGTDTFTYTVIDSLGARASGTIRIGIGQRLDGARNPIAVEDEVSARPGRTVSVRVLDNDSDPDGGILSITSVIPTGDATAKVKDDFVVVAVPEREGRFGFIYEIQNERGGTSSNFLTIVVSADAPLSRPDARDTVLVLSDVLDRTTIDVDVLANVFFADGSERDLGLSLLPGFADSARVTSGKKIEVTIADTAQIIPFTVSHPDDPSIVANAFIWVPGFNDALPQLRKGAPKLSVQSESTLTININDYVVAAGGKTVTLADTTTVAATHSNGANLVEADDRLSYTSEDRFFGPASLSFEVTDGDTTAVGGPRTATIVLPITVTPRKNQPPTFDNAVIDFEPDQSKVIDLVKLTTYRYPNDMGQLRYTVLDPKPTGFSWTLDGQTLTVRASSGTQKGASATLSIGVTDAMNEGSSGAIDMRVVASTRPIAVPASDSAVVQRGQTTAIAVLANDNATNPFPDVPLRVISVRGLDSASLPDGVVVSPSADNSTLTVRVAANAVAADATLQYQVADATSDPGRFAWGTVRISVQDRPDPVTSLAVTGFGDGSLTVAFNPGAFNNSAIAAYEISQVDAATGATISTSECRATTCTVQTRGNGQANSVRISVAARNAIGVSEQTVTAAPVWSDVVPAAPTGLTAAPLDKALALSWAAVPAAGGGTDVSRYVVTVNGVQQTEVSATGSTCAAGRCSVEVGQLTNGAAATFSISARNGAYPALTTWNSSSGSATPYGAPLVGSVSASGSVTDASVTVVWSPFDGNGDPVTGYVVQRVSSGTIPSGAQACTVSRPAPGSVSLPTVGGSVLSQQVLGGGATSAVFTGLDTSGAEYNFVVWGYNRAGCAAAASGAVTVRPLIGTITAQSGAMEARGDAIDYHVTGITSNGAAELVRYEIRAGEGGGVVPFTGTGWPRELLTQPWGAATSFQLRGCTVWGECGAWSRTFTAPEPSVEISFAMSDLAYDETTGMFSWAAGPVNGNSSVQYSCGVRDDAASVVAADPSANSCTLREPAPADTVRLNITVTVGGNTFIHSADL